MHINSPVLVCLLTAGIFSNLSAQPGPDPRVWNSYHDYGRLQLELKDLAQKHHDLIRLTRIGRSEQGRDIVMATITSFNRSPNPPHVWFDGAIHGSEVIASESMLYYIRFLVEQYHSNPTAKKIMDGWITFVVPMVNPDGVENGKTSDDYKQARKNGNAIDLNRNFDFRWTGQCDPKSSCKHCSADCWEYPGAAVFSESESQALRREILRARPSLYVAAHAGVDEPRLIRVEDSPDDKLYLRLQRCVASMTPFSISKGKEAGNAKGWVYWTAMQALRDAGRHPLAFNLEIYTIKDLKPGNRNHYWWCRYNPPAVLHDPVSKWCAEGTGLEPVDTQAQRMEFVRVALSYLTLSTGQVVECTAP